MSFLPFLLTSDTLYSAFISCPKSNHGVLWSALQYTRWSGLGCGAERGGSVYRSVFFCMCCQGIWDGGCTVEVVGWRLEVEVILCCGSITLGSVMKQRCVCAI